MLLPAGILSLPNNILAVEYLRLAGGRIHPDTDNHPRLGQGYHQLGDAEFASATAIRNEIENMRPLAEIKGLPAITREIWPGNSLPLRSCILTFHVSSYPLFTKPHEHR